jgi:hypothetical protein
VTFFWVAKKVSTTSRADATRSPSVTFFWVAHSTKSKFNLQTVPATGRLEEHVFAPSCKAKTASRLWIVWLRFIFLLHPFFFFFFSISLQLRMTQRQCGFHFHFRDLPGRYLLLLFSVSLSFFDPAKNDDYHLTQYTRGPTDTLP